jgi:hypothetical protein
MEKYKLTKVVLLAMVLALAAALPALANNTITFSDTTDVYEYRGTTATGPQKDVIGVSGFNTYGAKIEWIDQDVKITLYTNYPSAGNVSGLGDKVADLILTVDGTTYVVPLSSHDGLTAGAVYTATTLLTSTDQWKSTGYYYGGAYGSNANTYPTGFVSPIATWMTAGTKVFDGNTPVWSTGTGGGLYNIVLDLGNVDINNSFSDISLLWGTGNCANDTIAGGGQNDNPVPVPPTVLLLGSGLVGLGFWRFRKNR